MGDETKAAIVRECERLGKCVTVDRARGVFPMGNPSPEVWGAILTERVNARLAKIGSLTDAPGAGDVRELAAELVQLRCSVDMLWGGVINDIEATLLEKNAAYGDSATDPIRVFSSASPIEQLLVRIDDKLSRIYRGHDVPGEDTILDLIGYLVMLLIAMGDAEPVRTDDVIAKAIAEVGAVADRNRREPCPDEHCCGRIRVEAIDSDYNGYCDVCGAES